MISDMNNSEDTENIQLDIQDEEKSDELLNTIFFSENTSGEVIHPIELLYSQTSELKLQEEIKRLKDENNFLIQDLEKLKHVQQTEENKNLLNSNANENKMMNKLASIGGIDYGYNNAQSIGGVDYGYNKKVNKLNEYNDKNKYLNKLLDNSESSDDDSSTVKTITTENIDGSGNVIDSSGNILSNSKPKKSMTRYKKLTYKEVEMDIYECYFDKKSTFSSALDIIATYLRGQKLIYMESKTYCENKLNKLMMPSIFLSTAATVLSAIIKEFFWGAYLIAAVNGIIAFLLAVVNYLKLDAASEAHKISAHNMINYKLK